MCRVQFSTVRFDGVWVNKHNRAGGEVYDVRILNFEFLWETLANIKKRVLPFCCSVVFGEKGVLCFVLES